MKAKIGLMTVSILVSSSAFAGGSLKNGVLIVPNNGDAAAVLESLQDNGFRFSGNVQCAPTAKFVRILPSAKDSKILKVSCVSDFGSKTVAVPMNQINTGSAKGDPSEFEGTATGDPNEFEGTATGDPNEFEGTATGDPNEFEGTATGDPNEFEGTATGDPNEFEGTATGDPNEFEGTATGSADSRKSPIVRFLGKIEKAARSVHARIYKLITE